MSIKTRIKKLEDQIIDESPECRCDGSGVRVERTGPAADPNQYQANCPDCKKPRTARVRVILPAKMSPEQWAETCKP